MNPKHSTVPVAKKKKNSIPDKIRTGDQALEEVGHKLEESPYLEIFKSYLDMFLGNWFQDTEQIAKFTHQIAELGTGTGLKICNVIIFVPSHFFILTKGANVSAVLCKYRETLHWTSGGQTLAYLEDIFRDFLGKQPLKTKESRKDELVKPLSIIYQQSWLTGEVPDGWKLDSVTVIHKKGGKEDSGNYRPVNLTSVPGKIMEQFILSIMQHLQDGQSIRPSQHGFRRGRSCLTNLVFFYDQMTRLVDAEKAMGVVYLDFSKAFDTASHSIPWKSW
ncbi:hypothetical protein TURU_018857 [Turdus rufiventris]|nr:hypothetical protein TURU_018857 [Turdus rufiventris]